MTAAGPLLASQRLDEFRALGAFGQPVYRAYGQLRAALVARLGDRYADFFARPDIHDGVDRIDWFSPVPGDAVAWADLSPERQAALGQDIKAMLDRYRSLAAEYRSTNGGSGSGAVFAEILERSLSIPDEKRVFLVGDQPVITFWGFETTQAASAAAPLDRIASMVPKASVPPPPVTPVTAPVLPVRHLTFWGILWRALLLLLLLLLILLGLRWCQVIPPGVLPDIGLIPQQDQPNAPPDQKLGPDGRPLVIVPGDGTATGPAIGVVPGVDGKTDADKAAADKAAADKADANKPDTPKPDANKPEDKKDDPPKPPDQKADAQKNQPPKPDANKPEDQAKPLTIPEDARRSGDVGFMEGEWKSQGGLVDKRTGRPLDQRYKFDKNGDGQVTIRQSDGTTCTGKAKASMQGGKLSVQELEDAKCPDGSTFNRARTDCQVGADGKAQCKGVNPDGSGYNVQVGR